MSQSDPKRTIYLGTRQAACNPPQVAVFNNAPLFRCDWDVSAPANLTRQSQTLDGHIPGLVARTRNHSA